MPQRPAQPQTSLSQSRLAVSFMGLSFPLPCLCLVTDRSVGDPGTLVQRVSLAVSGGVDIVQLREKDLPGGELLGLANAIQQAIAVNAIMLINERVDVALAAGADGVQLREDGLPIAPVRRMLGSQSLIGRSVHSADGAAKAGAEGADFLVAGTMYATRSHPGVQPIGPSLIRDIVQQQAGTPNPLPVIGIGGITEDNLGEVVRAGASGVAVITSILASSDPKGEARKLKNAMLKVWQGEPLDSAKITGPR